ncbi:MAG: B12-binding domain-containing radical SAM protein [Verrucomicrobiota bacterium]
MKVHLLQAKRDLPCRTNKDTNGSYGTANDFGDSVTSRILAKIKSRAMNFPELAPAYAASILRGQGHSVTYSDNETNPDADITLLQSSMVHFSEEKKWALRAKQENPKMRVGFFSGVCDTLGAELLECGDFVIAGEFEQALADGDIGAFEGIVDGKRIGNLNEIPMPSWKHIKSSIPYNLITKRKNTRLSPMITTRGCPMSCRFYCTYPLVQGVKHRERDVENVMEEISLLNREYGINLILFRDPIFTLDMKRAKAFCQALIESDLDVNYIIETHVKYVDEELIDLLAKSGCSAIKFGIEGGNQEVMKQSKRASNRFEEQEKTLRQCEEKGIKVLAFFILAYFHDTVETVRETIDYAIRLNPYGAQFTVATPYPGTPWYEQLRSENEKYQLSENYDDYTQYQLVYNHPHLTYSDVHRLKNEAYRRFYFRPSYIARHHSPGGS